MIMDQLVDKDEEGETEDTLAEEEAVLAIPTGPITRAMTRRLKEAVGNILKISKEQEDCLVSDKEFKSLRVIQEAMGSEENDETFMRRNKMLQEAITKQVMDAMVKLLEEKYDQRPNDGQGQASGQRREQRRNRQGQREHAGSEETDNFYERSSQSSAEEEAVLAIPTGPITRAMTRRLKEAVGNILKISKEQEDCLDLVHVQGSLYLSVSQTLILI
ncbi:hypothetical protein IGI04_042945 [Brassica rapa subsp. trilocularis]|uniref:Uncharacterized protein n=1 Tax=Brassica rapa subsp. trilocularis TaxID=1813537 RepID=A0ABQ7KJP4_BRACM|nr:hypothetical protein IGI04_042945 [Brassica rapa subsp. trilocularis]